MKLNMFFWLCVGKGHISNIYILKLRGLGTLSIEKCYSEGVGVGLMGHGVKPYGKPSQNNSQNLDIVNLLTNYLPDPIITFLTFHQPIQCSL